MESYNYCADYSQNAIDGTKERCCGNLKMRRIVPRAGGGCGDAECKYKPNWHS